MKEEKLQKHLNCKKNFGGAAFEYILITTISTTLGATLLYFTNKRIKTKLETFLGKLDDEKLASKNSGKQ